MKSIAVAASAFMTLLSGMLVFPSAGQADDRQGQITSLKAQTDVAEKQASDLERRSAVCAELSSNPKDVAQWKYYFDKKRLDAVPAHDVRQRLAREAKSKKISEKRERQSLEAYEEATKAETGACQKAAALVSYRLAKAQQRVSDLKSRLATLVAQTECTWRLSKDQLGPGMNGQSTLEKLQAAYTGLTGEFSKSHAVIKVSDMNFDISWDEPPACVVFGDQHGGDFKLKLTVTVTGKWNAYFRPSLDIYWDGFAFHPIDGRDIEATGLGTQTTTYTVRLDNPSMTNPYLFVNIYRLGAIATWHYDRVR